jgi:hypothetical protein
MRFFILLVFVAHCLACISRENAKRHVEAHNWYMSLNRETREIKPMEFNIIGIEIMMLNTSKNRNVIGLDEAMKLYYNGEDWLHTIVSKEPPFFSRTTLKWVAALGWSKNADAVDIVRTLLMDDSINPFVDAYADPQNFVMKKDEPLNRRNFKVSEIATSCDDIASNEIRVVGKAMSNKWDKLQFDSAVTMDITIGEYYISYFDILSANTTKAQLQRERLQLLARETCSLHALEAKGC